MLMLYADCLKQLGQKDDYVRVILKILAKTAAEPMSISLFDVSISSNRPSTSLATTARASSLSVVDFAADLLSYSSDLDHEISVPMDRYFSDIMVSPYLRHYDDKDGLQLQLFFRCLLEDRIPIRSVRVRISGTVDGQPRETWLENEGPLSIKSNPVRIWVGSNVGGS